MKRKEGEARIKALELENRLIRFAAKVTEVAENLPSTMAGKHIAGQIIRSSMVPAPNYGEAQGAESRKDFIHKMKICLKELRETQVWLKIMIEKRYMKREALQSIMQESNELVAIFVTSIETARKNMNSR